MDISTVVGLSLCILAVMGSIMSGGSLTIFIDVASILVVFGGLLGSTFIRWPLEVIKNLPNIIKNTLFFIT